MTTSIGRCHRDLVLQDRPSDLLVVTCLGVACGMSAYAAVLEALLDRAITGSRRGIAVSLFDGTADWMNVPLLYAEGTGRNPARLGLEHPSICPYGAYPTVNGSLVLISIQNEREWAAFCTEVLDDPALPSWPGFESNNAKLANRAAVNAVVAAALRRLNREHVATRLRTSRIALGFVNTLTELGGTSRAPPGRCRHSRRHGEHRRAACDPWRRHSRSGACPVDRPARRRYQGRVPPGLALLTVRETP